jgi:hypothetical protein
MTGYIIVAVVAFLAYPIGTWAYKKLTAKVTGE